MEQNTNALEALAKRLEFDLKAIESYSSELGHKVVADVRDSQRIVAELAKVRMTSPMLKFKRPAADESVKAVDKCREIAEKGES